MPVRDQVELSFATGATPRRVSLPAAALHAERVELVPTRFDFSVTGSTHYIALHDILMRDGALRVGRCEPIRQTDLRGKITFLPAGTPVDGWTDPLARRNSFVAIHFAESAIPEPLRGAANYRAPAVYFEDRGLVETLAKLARALNRDEPLLELLAESLCDVAIVEFGLLRTAAPASMPRAAPMLSARKISTVRDFIAANLAAPVTLAELSAVAGLSKFHFSRAFKAATGRSPYNEVLNARLVLARRLLGEGMAAGDASVKTGFTSAAQLRRSLRQHPADKPARR